MGCSAIDLRGVTFKYKNADERAFAMSPWRFRLVNALSSRVPRDAERRPSHAL